MLHMAGNLLRGGERERSVYFERICDSQKELLIIRSCKSLEFIFRFTTCANAMQ
jgi:hypothetical protein